MLSQGVAILGVTMFIIYLFYKLDAIHTPIVKELHERKG